jgi:hypothetical protein
MGYGEAFASTCQVTEMRLGVMLNGTCPPLHAPNQLPRGGEVQRPHQVRNALGRVGQDTPCWPARQDG